MLICNNERAVSFFSIDDFYTFYLDCLWRRSILSTLIETAVLTNLDDLVILGETVVEHACNLICASRCLKTI